MVIPFPHEVENDEPHEGTSTTGYNPHIETTSIRPIEPMTQEEFQVWAEGFMESIIDMMKSKGEDYSRMKDPAFKNFVQGSEILGVSKQMYLLTLVTKHFAGLLEDPIGHKSLSLLKERATDIIVYMLLLIAMTEEDSR